MMTFSNKVYDILKWVCLIVLPACSTLYFTLSGIWHLPYGEQVTGTLAAISTFIGILIGVSTKSYYKEEKKNDESK